MCQALRLLSLPPPGQLKGEKDSPADNPIRDEEAPLGGRVGVPATQSSQHHLDPANAGISCREERAFQRLDYHIHSCNGGQQML